MKTKKTSPSVQIGVAELAKMLGKSVRVIRQHAGRGKIPSARIVAGVWIFDLAAVEGWTPAPQGWTPGRKRPKKPAA